MALSVTSVYNDDIGRVQISVTGANVDADYVKVEHSLDNITWNTVRGGATVPLVSGAGHVDHYDGFVFGVTNYYRVSTFDSALVQPIAAGAYTTANNATVTPPLPAGLVAGNMMIAFVTHRNTAATCNTPAGWTAVAGGASHVAAFYKVYAPGDTAPSCTFSGGSAGDSCSGIIWSFSNASAPVQAAFQVNASAQDVAYPGASVAYANPVWLLHEWKQATGTGASLPNGFGDPKGGFNTAGANAESSVIWRTTAESDQRTIVASSNSWQGGSAAISKARLLTLQARGALDSGNTSLTPSLPNANTSPYWIKNPNRPGQNTRVEIMELVPTARQGRNGVFPILGRSFPVVVSDTMTSRSFSLVMDAGSRSAARDLEARFAIGNPMYLQAPSGSDDVPTLYFVVDKCTVEQDAKQAASWTVSVDCTECAMPNPTVYGDTYIWNDVVTGYATWADVIAGNATWSALIDKISTSVIVVP